MKAEQPQTKMGPLLPFRRLGARCRRPELAKWLAKPGAHRFVNQLHSDPRCQGTNPCYLMTNVAFFGASNAGVMDTNNYWSNNVSFGGSAPSGLGPHGNLMLGSDTMNCSSGANSTKCNVDPGFTNPAAGNFALTAASPAMVWGRAACLRNRSTPARAITDQARARECPEGMDVPLVINKIFQGLKVPHLDGTDTQAVALIFISHRKQAAGGECLGPFNPSGR
jgi:hypothetical protein